MVNLVLAHMPGHVPGLCRKDMTEAPGSGVRILNHPAPPPLGECIRCAEQCFLGQEKILVGGRDAGSHELIVQLPAFDTCRTGPSVDEGAPLGLHYFTFVEDFGRALVTAALDERARGRAWIVPKDRAVTQGQFAALFARESGRVVRFSVMGRGMIAAAGIFSHVVGGSCDAGLRAGTGISPALSPAQPPVRRDRPASLERRTRHACPTVSLHAWTYASPARTSTERPPPVA